MPRKPRFILPGEPQHVIIRGINREPIFYSERDYRYYLGRLKAALRKHHCTLHAYVLMSNHVHFLMSPTDENGIGKTVQSLGRCYVQYFNHVYGRTGTLWEGRYKAALIDTEDYLLTCHRYIELNPVRARMVDHPSAYPWSSYHSNALGQTNPLLTPHNIYLELGLDETTRLKNYRSLFTERIPDRVIAEIRDATNKEWVLGNGRFKDKISNRLERKVIPQTRGGDRKSLQFKQRVINRH